MSIKTMVPHVRVPGALKLQVLGPRLTGKDKAALIALGVFLGKCSQKRLYIPLVVDIPHVAWPPKSQLKNRYPQVLGPGKVGHPCWAGLDTILKAIEEWETILDAMAEPPLWRVVREIAPLELTGSDDILVAA